MSRTQLINKKKCLHRVYMWTYRADPLYDSEDLIDLEQDRT